MELDYSEIHRSRKIRGTEQSESIEDKRFGEILTKGLHRNANGNWQAPLPFKSDGMSLPNNKGHCLRRLLSLKRRLLNNEKLKDDYLAFMKKTLDNGHASLMINWVQKRAKHGSFPTSTYTIQGNQIKSESCLTAAPSSKTIPLNKHLLQGPDQLNYLERKGCLHLWHWANVSQLLR